MRPQAVDQDERISVQEAGAAAIPPESTGTLAAVLAKARSKGVRLWVEEGRLRYAAAKGTLTPEEVEELRALKSELIAFLGQATDSPATPWQLERRRPRNSRIPLTYSQSAHYRLYRLHERRGLRQVASATRIRGFLNIEALERAVAEMQLRHEALRTRIVCRDGTPLQEVWEAGPVSLEVEALPLLPASLQEQEVSRRIRVFIATPIDVAVDPLFSARLLRLNDQEHVLILAMEHMIADAFSMGVLLRDLSTAYAQLSRGQNVTLPPVQVPFADYALWQTATAEVWLQEHEPYWKERLTGIRRLRFPQGNHPTSVTSVGWRTVPLRIDASLKKRLREWCRSQGTTLPMAVFTAYIGFVLRWCNASEGIFQYQSDGRPSQELENAIGYFSSVLYLRLALRHTDRWPDLLARVTEEYCQAYEHADFSYFEAQDPRPEFTRNTCFNWVPRSTHPSLFGQDGSEDAMASSATSLEHPMLETLERDNEPMVLVFDTDEEILGGVYFPANRFSLEIMERFAQGFQNFVGSLLGEAQLRVKDIPL